MSALASGQANKPSSMSKACSEQGHAVAQSSFIYRRALMAKNSLERTAVLLVVMLYLYFHLVFNTINVMKKNHFTLSFLRGAMALLYVVAPHV